jgi:hypothetical protein
MNLNIENKSLCAFYMKIETKSNVFLKMANHLD